MKKEMEEIRDKAYREGVEEGKRVQEKLAQEARPDTAEQLVQTDPISEPVKAP